MQQQQLNGHKPQCLYTPRVHHHHRTIRSHYRHPRTLPVCSYTYVCYACTKKCLQKQWPQQNHRYFRILAKINSGCARVCRFALCNLFPGTRTSPQISPILLRTLQHSVNAASDVRTWAVLVIHVCSNHAILSCWFFFCNYIQYMYVWAWVKLDWLLYVHMLFCVCSQMMTLSRRTRARARRSVSSVDRVTWSASSAPTTVASSSTCVTTTARRRPTGTCSASALVRSASCYNCESRAWRHCAAHARVEEHDMLLFTRSIRVDCRCIYFVLSSSPVFSRSCLVYGNVRNRNYSWQVFVVFFVNQLFYSIMFEVSKLVTFICRYSASTCTRTVYLYVFYNVFKYGRNGLTAF